MEPKDCPDPKRWERQKSPGEEVDKQTSNSKPVYHFTLVANWLISLAEDFTPSCHKNGRSCHISIVFRMIIRTELLADVTSLADDHWGRWLAFHLPCCHLRLRIFLICFWNRKPTLSDGTKQRWERKKRVNFYFLLKPYLLGKEYCHGLQSWIVTTLTIVACRF